MPGPYVFELEIPAGMPETAPVQGTLTIEGAVLDRLHVLIPKGHHALARLAIFYGINQIFPYEPGTWLRGNGESMSLRMNWPLPESKTRLTFKGWNEDGRNPHTFYLRLEVTEEVEEARPWRVITDFVAILKKLMGL